MNQTLLTERTWPDEASTSERDMTAQLRPLLLRLGLIGAGALALRISHSLMLGDAPLIRQPHFVLWLVVTGGIGLALWTLAALPRVPKQAVWLILLICALDVGLRFHVAQATAETPMMVQAADAAKLDFAARLLLQGENPYAWDYAGIYPAYEINAPALLTPLDRYPFPALGFLLALPFEALGLPSVPVLSALVYLALIVALFIASPDWLRPLILLPLFAADSQLLSQRVAFGSVDVLWAAALAFTALLWRTPFRGRSPLSDQNQNIQVVLSFPPSPQTPLPHGEGLNDETLPLRPEGEGGRGVEGLKELCLLLQVVYPYLAVGRGLMLGAALALHPLAWLALPFLLVRAAAEDGFAAAGRTGLLALSVFGVVNLPFVLWDAGAWLESLASSLRVDRLASGGLFAFWPGYAVFALVVVYGLLLWLYARHLDRLRPLAWLAPALIASLLPSARLEVWIFAVLPVVAAWATNSPHPLSPPLPQGEGDVIAASSPRLGGSSLPVSLSVGAGIITTLVVVGMAAFPMRSTLTLEAQYPLYTDANGRIETITLHLHNDSGDSVTPAFFVHPRFEEAAQRWRIIDGPESLAPDESANYVIQPLDTEQGFFVGATIQVVDTGGAHSTMLKLGDYEDYAFPDNVFNSRFHLWTAGASAPNGWTLTAAPLERATASMTIHAERPALTLAIAPSDGPTLASLESTIPFPYAPFDVWVWGGELDDSLTFGLEFDDGQHRVVFDFAADVADVRTSDNAYRETRPIPVREWSLQRIDLRAVYAAAGWELPPFRAIVYRELELDWRLIEVRLVLAGRTEQPISAYIGGIVQPLERVSPRTLMQESLANPVETYQRIAAWHLRMRNEHLALAALETALTYADADQQAALQAEIDGLRHQIDRLAAVGGR
ncbi:MAG: hypothetical protein SF029_24480 [bacterium]|nr:hypothetical protein [bacterium]